MNPVQVIAVTSGKGGVGKTNVSVNLSCQLARQGKRVLLMDADLGLANVDILMGLRPTRNLAHVLAGECELRDTLITGAFGVTLIPAASGMRNMADLSPAQHARLVQAFSTLEDDYDVLVVDTAAGISDSVVSFSRASQHVLVVITEEPTSLADAYGLIKVLARDAGVQKFKIVCNMVSSDAQARKVFERLCAVTERFLDVHLTLVGAIPRDEFLRKAVARQKPVSELFPATESVQAFSRLAMAATQWRSSNSLRGHIEFFFERMLPAPEVSIAC